jgi:CheY-like chemotaxis protein
MALHKNILVVDDNQDVADTTAFLLQAYGFNVSVAYGGPEALVIARAIHPDLVLLDIGMPVMDGYEVARRLRADAELCTAKLVAFTA